MGWLSKSKVPTHLVKCSGAFIEEQMAAELQALSFLKKKSFKFTIVTLNDISPVNRNEPGSIADPAISLVNTSKPKQDMISDVNLLNYTQTSQTKDNFYAPFRSK